MNINFESLNDISKILTLLTSVNEKLEKGTVEKRWFNTRELAEYSGYKFETIQSKIKKGEFIQGVHYFKKGGMLLFDKTEVDNWVMGVKSANNVTFENAEVTNIVDDVLDLIA